MLIKNYGLFWRRDSVFWGKGSNAGHLNGVLATNITAEPVNFREQQGVYCLYDDSFQLVYAGQAGSGNDQYLFDRLKRHMRDQLADRWEKFSWFGIRRVNGDGSLQAKIKAIHSDLPDVLNHIEAILIASSEPKHNRQGGRFGDSVEQYLQVRDEENLGPQMEEMVRTLWQNGA